MLGGTLASLPKAGETPNLNGSVLSVVADNEEEVKKFLKTDIYFKEGVWDVENAKIFPVSIFTFYIIIYQLYLRLIDHLVFVCCQSRKIDEIYNWLLRMMNVHKYINKYS